MDEVENLKKEIVDATTQAAVKRVEEESEKLKASFHSELQAFADSIEKRLNGGFGRIDAQDRKEMDVLVGAYFAKEICNQKVINKAWDASTSGGASELIPSEIATRLVEKLTTYSLLRQNCTIYPDDKGTVFGEGTAATASRIATRGTASNETTPSYTPVTYATVGMQAWLGVDNKVVRESPLRVFDWVTDILVKAIAAKEYVEFITGTGTNAFKGLDNLSITALTAASTHTAMDKLNKSDAENWYRALPQAYRMLGKNIYVIGTSTLAAQLASLNTTGYEVWNYLVQPEKWHGYPFWEHASVTSSGTDHPVGYFGDLSYYYIFDKLGLMIKSTDQGKTAMLADQTIVMVYNETYGNTPLTDAFRSLKLAGS